MSKPLCESCSSWNFVSHIEWNRFAIRSCCTTCSKPSLGFLHAVLTCCTDNFNNIDINFVDFSCVLKWGVWCETRSCKGWLHKRKHWLLLQAFISAREQIFCACYSSKSVLLVLCIGNVHNMFYHVTCTALDDTSCTFQDTLWRNTQISWTLSWHSWDFFFLLCRSHHLQTQPAHSVKETIIFCLI